MKPKEQPGRGGFVFLRLLFIAVTAMLPLGSLAAYPSWWSNYGVLSGTTPNDYAVANQGQAKNIALAAVNELDYDLAQFGGSQLDSLAVQLLPETATANDYAVVNLGQLKALAQPFFERLLFLGYTGPPLTSGTYPWAAPGAGQPNDFAAGNIGQLKFLFSFDVTYSSAQNGIPDWWVNSYFPGSIISGTTGVNPDAYVAWSGSEITLIEAYTNGWNPIDYYNGRPPVLTIVSGSGQTGSPDGFVSAPLIVSVTDTNGNPLYNAPVTFTATSGNVQASSTSASANTLTLLANSSGQVQIFFQLPASVSSTSQITVTTGASATSAQVVFTEFSDNGGGSYASPFAPTNVIGSMNSGGSETITWQNNDSQSPIYVYLQVSGTWQVTGTIPAGATTYTASASMVGSVEIGNNYSPGGSTGIAPGGGNPGDVPFIPIPGLNYAILVIGPGAPKAICDAGYVVGFSSYDYSGIDFLWQSGSSTTLFPPSGYNYADPVGVSGTTGQVQIAANAAPSWMGRWYTDGYLWQQGSWTFLDLPDEHVPPNLENGSLRAMNEQGEIIGNVIYGYYAYQAAVEWVNTVPTDLEWPQPDPVCWAINGNGDIGGWNADETLLDGSDIGAFNGVLGVNDQKDMATGLGVLVSGTLFPIPDGATAINDADQALDFFGQLWMNPSGKAYELIPFSQTISSSAITAAGLSTSNGIYADAINNAGVIAGHGYDAAGGSEEALVLLPADIAIKKKGDPNPPPERSGTNGVVVKVGDVLEIALDPTWFDKDSQFQSLITWQFRPLRGDGNWGWGGEGTSSSGDEAGWQSFGDSAKGTTFEYTTQYGGIFEVRAIITSGIATQKILYVRQSKDPTGTHAAGLFQGFLYDVGSPNFFGVVSTQKQLDVLAMARSCIGVDKWNLAHAVTIGTGLTLGPNLDLCNVFVYQVFNDYEGVPIPLRSDTGHPPSAHNWWDANYAMTGWPWDIGNDAVEPGIVVSRSTPVGTGHCGILDYDGAWISAPGKRDSTVNRAANIRDGDPDATLFGIPFPRASYYREYQQP